MKALWNLITIIVIILGIIALIAAGGGLLVLLAYGVGLLVNLILRIDPFQATVLSLAAIVVVGWITIRVITSPGSIPGHREQDSEEEEEEDDEDGDEYLDEDFIEEKFARPVIDLRQPLKRPDFSNVLPDDRCPCGSGRKFKNCHGSTRRTR